MDSGEFSGAAFYLGIAHAPGYPGYLLLGKLFTLVPVQSIAFSLNAFSAVTAALCVPLLASILGEVIQIDDVPWLQKTFSSGKRWGVWATAWAFGVSGTFWYQANIAEQYALHIFTFLLVLHSVFQFYLHEDFRFLLLAALAGGLAIAIHPLLLAYAGPLLMLVLIRSLQPVASWLILPLLFFFFAGYSVHLFLPLRAAASPPFNWGDPDTIRRFLYLITAEETRAAYPHLKKWLNLRSPILGNGMLELIYLLAPLLIAILAYFKKNLFLKVVRFTSIALLLLTLYILIATPFLDQSLRIFSFSVWLDRLFFQYTFLLMPFVIVGGYFLYRSHAFLFLALFYFFFMAFPYNISANFGHNNPVLHDRHKMVGYCTMVFFLAAGITPLLGFLNILARRVKPIRYLILLPAAGLLAFPLGYQWKKLNQNNADFMEAYGEDVFASMADRAVLIAKGTEIVFPLWYLQYVEKKRQDVEVVLADALSNPWYIQNLRQKSPGLLRSVPPFPGGKKWSLRRLQERGEYLNRIAEEIIKGNIERRPVYYSAGPSDFMLDPLKKYRVIPQGLVFRIAERKKELPEDLQPIESLLARYRSVARLRMFAQTDWMARYFYSSFAVIHTVLAQQALSAGDLEVAKDHYERALQYDSNFLPALKQYALLLQGEDLDQALKTLQKAQKLAPLDPQIWNNLGVLYEKKGKREEARKAYKKALELFPRYVNAHYNLGILEAAEGNFYSARQELKEALELAPQDPQIRIDYAKVLLKLGKKKEAEKTLLEAAEDKKLSSPLLYFALAEFYDREGKGKLAAQWRDRFEKSRASK